MAQAARLNLRMQKELKLLLTDPPLGASFPFLSDESDLKSLSAIEAHIKGPEGTVYANGVFKLKIQIPERYPFQPPSVTFATPIYHPNIDNGGRICLDILNLPPKGAWQPSLNISTVITSIGLLLSEPNPDDGLMCEASKEYKYNRQVFNQKARAMTEKYARGDQDCLAERIQTNSDISTVVEDKHLEKEVKHEIGGFVFNHSKPGGISRKLSLGSSNEKMLATHSNSSGNLVMSSSANPPTYQDSVHNLENESTVTKCKQECSVSKKLSLSFKVSSAEKQEQDNKENVILGNKLSFSNTNKLQIRKVGIGHKLSQTHKTPEVPDKDESHMHKLDGESKQCDGELHESESLIVLDSEDSEEETNGSAGSNRKLSIVRRKLIGKRKAQA